MPFVRGHRTVSPRTPRNICVYTCGMLTRLPHKLAKNGMRVKTSADPRLKNKLRVYTASEVNWLTTNQRLPFVVWLKCSDVILKCHLHVIQTEKWNQVMTVLVRYPGTRIPGAALLINCKFTYYKAPKKVSGFWSLFALPQTRTSACLVFFLCPIEAKFAGSTGILMHCVLNDFFT